jgi:hypothetical protein
MVYFAPRSFGFLVTAEHTNIIKPKITIPKITFLIPFLYPSLSPAFPSSFIFLSYIVSPFRLHSVFLVAPFTPSLSIRYIHSTCAQLSLSPYSTFCTFYSLLPSNAIIFLPLVLSLPRYSGIFSVIHFSYSLLYLG